MKPSVILVSVLCLSGNFIKCSGTIVTSNSICSFEKSSQECLCIYKNDPSSVFPIFFADCSRMGLKQFPKINEVEDLDISHNVIEILDPLKTSFESNRIRSLRLSFNRLHFVYQDFFKDMPNLVNLDLSNNELVKFSNSLIFRGISKLEILNLGSNGISTLPDNIFEGLPNLKELDLSYNYLGSLFSNSESLFQSNLGLNSNLTTLKLDGLGITKISSNFFDGAKNLEYLSLSDNALVSIPNVPETLTYLDISGSDIKTISSQELTGLFLKTLKLNRLLKLETIESNSFSTLKLLEELQLSDCKKLKQLNFLLSFGGDDFSKNHEYAIKRLYMSRSGLRTISSNFLSIFKNMDFIDLENNPLNCDCDIIWLLQSNMTQLHIANLRCAAPNTLSNKKVMQLTKNDFSNCFENNLYQTVVMAILCCFLGVLAALIIYLVYLGPLYHKNQYRNIGPQSPYSGNTLRVTPVVDNDQ